MEGDPLVVLLSLRHQSRQNGPEVIRVVERVHLHNAFLPRVVSVARSTVLLLFVALFLDSFNRELNVGKPRILEALRRQLELDAAYRLDLVEIRVRGTAFGLLLNHGVRQA